MNPFGKKASGFIAKRCQNDLARGRKTSNGLFLKDVGCVIKHMGHILIVAPSGVSTLGGSATWIDYIVPGLRRRGWQVTLGRPLYPGIPLGG